MINSIIDTNVIVSSLIQRSYSYHIMYDLFINDKFQLYISDKIIEEYYRVLQRPKFAKYPDFYKNASNIIAMIELKAKKFYPQTIINIISDVSDNMFLELAEISKADFIITGNTNDFTFSKYKDTSIVTPRYFFDYFSKNNE